MPKNNKGISRRAFTKTACGAAAALSISAPSIATAKRSESQTVRVGEGDYQYEVNHNWAQLPDEFRWQTTHNVAVGKDGLVYVTHEGNFNQPDHPSIFVFDPEGTYVRSFGSQFQGGGHGIEIRQEAGEDMLYVSVYQQQRSIAKLSAIGDEIWRQGAPMESGLYAEGEDEYPRKKDNPWGRDRYMPTNIAFHPESGFYVADGYGAWRIHFYDDDGKWVRSFGKPSGGKKADGTFALPHGIWIDDRGDEPLIVIADRANARVQWFDMDEQHVRTDTNFILPANLDTHGDLLMVPDLAARVTLLGKDNEVVAQLGTDTDRVVANQKKHNSYQLRTDPSQWQDGKFIHPHDACFDADGNIYVTEWVQGGRVTKLTKVS